MIQGRKPPAGHVTARNLMQHTQRDRALDCPEPAVTGQTGSAAVVRSRRAGVRPASNRTLTPASSAPYVG